MLNLLLCYGNVSISHPYVLREQRRLAQARLRPGSASAQVGSGVLRPAQACSPPYLHAY
jgi:hypothetical protein